MKNHIICIIYFVLCFVISMDYVRVSFAAFPERVVVIYTAVDQLFSEPILKQFEQQYHIRTKVVYDVEAVKSTGLVNRLIAESKVPRCDVFWNSEVLRTIILKRKQILDSFSPEAAHDIDPWFKDSNGFWTGFAGRFRVLAVNTQLVEHDNYPATVDDLTDSQWKGKIAMANPMFGTTAMFVASLFATRGETAGRNLLVALKNNQTQIVDGNAVVRDMVAAGSVVVGLTDMDDVMQGIKSAMPLKAILPSGQVNGGLLIPCTVSLIRGAPHPEEARKLIEYLLSREVEQHLIDVGFSQVALRKGNDEIPAESWNYDLMADNLPIALKYAQQLFMR